MSLWMVAIINEDLMQFNYFFLKGAPYIVQKAVYQLNADQMHRNNTYTLYYT